MAISFWTRTRKESGTRCVRPEHLFLGTQIDNIKDRHSKGHSRGGKLSGEMCRHNKLTQEQVEIIRRSTYYWHRARDLSIQFGVSMTCIYKVLNNLTWVNSVSDFDGFKDAIEEVML